MGRNFSLLLALALVVCGCSASGEAPVRGPFRGARLDVRSGRVGGVGLREPQSRLIARFGRGRVHGENQRLVPDPVLAPDWFPAGRVRAYEGAAVVLFPDGRIAAFVVYAQGVRTREGVGVGDPLSDVRRRYPAAECMKEVDTEEGPIPADCELNPGPGTYVDFLADESDGDVESIAVSSKPVHGGCEGRTDFPSRRSVARCLREARTGRG